MSETEFALPFPDDLPGTELDVEPQNLSRIRRVARKAGGLILAVPGADFARRAALKAASETAGVAKDIARDKEKRRTALALGAIGVTTTFLEYSGLANGCLSP